MLIRVLKDWDWPDLMRQTPGATGRWEDVQFSLESEERCDYVVVLNRVTKNSIVVCAPENIWSISQESPVPEYEWYRQGYQQFQRVFTPEIRFDGQKFVHSHGALPWHIDKSYDELTGMGPPEKCKPLSWVTSNKHGRSGHRARLAFLERIEDEVEFDLWGWGFRPLRDKWDGLAPYRYSLAVENYSGPHYWTEKLADCFLSWTMPIYYGCTNLDAYFPPQSFIAIDINDPDVGKRINEAMQSDLWLKHRDALEHARGLVLDKYQFFPFVTEKIRKVQSVENASAVRRIELHELPNRYPFSPMQRIKRQAARFMRWVKHG